MQLSRPLDAIDRKILALLQENAKLTFAQVGVDVGLSSTAVKRRVDRLQSDGENDDQTASHSHAAEA